MPNQTCPPLPADFLRLQELWKEIRRDLFDNGNARDCKRYEDGLNSAAWAWEPEFEYLLPEKIDRKSQVLLGPVFSSKENPWPEDQGQPMIPLAQLDLDIASKIGGVDLGSGLLQLFCKVGDRLGQDIETRVIERSSVTSEELAYVPTFSDEIEGFASVGWAQTDESKNRRMYGSECIQIIGFKEPRFTLWMPSPISEQYDLGRRDLQVRMAVTEFEQILEKNSDSWSPGGFHLFGTFYPIQYYPGDRPRPLFTLESEHGFEFGDGQAQVFYKIHPEFGAMFSFEWSCY